MFKFASLALGLLTVVMIAPSSQATIFQNRPTLPSTNRELHAQKLAPIKKSVLLRTTVIEKTPVKVPSYNKNEPKQEGEYPVYDRNLLNDRARFGSNERADDYWSRFNNDEKSGCCGRNRLKH